PDITLPAVTSLTALPPAHARKALSILEGASLVDRRPRGRYAMHDLIRSYATTTASCLAEEIRDTALRRVLDFYTHTAHAAEHLLNPHAQLPQLAPPTPGAQPQPLSNIPEVLDWFETEHSNLLAAQQIAIAYNWGHTVWLASVLSTFHTWRGHRRDRLAVWQAALDAAARMNDPVTHTLAHRIVGRSYADLGSHEQAIGHLRQALALAEHHNDPIQQAHTHRMLAWAWERRGNFRQALKHAGRAKNLYQDLNQSIWEADALNAVGWLTAHLGDYDTARAHCQIGLTLFRQHRHSEGQAHTLNSLGYIAHRTGHHRQAIDHYRQALPLFRSLGATTSVADTLDTLGQADTALGQHDQARAAWREALELYREQGRDTDADRVQKQLDELDNTTNRSADAAADRP
ncbi:tetratricopeptide repeat protein, partial [Saccharothrix longispora]|uniref:tetratricopeptide repeat protein n=1 Tax=Saccharothrix longispora TaxID=33920 RepID=UPI0028FD947A